MSEKHIGEVVQVIGPVLDIRFAHDELPPLLNAIEIDNDGAKLVAEVAQQVGDDLKYASMRNSFTPGNFVSLEEEVTVDINGTATTFPAGTYYGEIMQAQIDADGVKIKVWDPTANDGAGSSDGFDGWYSPENAVEELNQAVEELAADGLTIDADNPIQMDVVYASSSEVFTNRANSLKQQSSLSKLLQMDLFR